MKGRDIAAAAAQPARDLEDARPYLGEAGAPGEMPTRPRVKLVCAADVQPVQVEWLWPGFLPFGKVVSIVGVPGVGKSTAVADLIARATRGGPMPGETETFDPITVFIGGVEDGWADTVRPRLDAARAALSRVQFVTMAEAETLTLPRDVGALAVLAREHGARWLHIDAIMGTLADDVNAYRDHEVRRALGPVKELAESHELLITYIGHPRKAGGSAVNAGGGSVAFGALARVLLFAGFDPTDDTTDVNERRRVLAVGKNNLSITPPSRTFQIVPGSGGLAGCIAWGGTTAVSADDLAHPQEGPAPARGERPDAPRNAAEDFLEDLLKGGRRLKRDEVVAAARDAGHKWRTIERAATDIGVTKERAGFAGGSIWYLALNAEADAIPATDDPFPPFAPAISTHEKTGANGANGGNGPAEPSSAVEWCVFDRWNNRAVGAVTAEDEPGARRAAERAGFGVASHRVVRRGAA